MKTQIHQFLAAAFIWAYTGVNAKESNPAKYAAQVIIKHDTAYRTESQKPHCAEHESSLKRAMGAIEGSYFLQDIRVYLISAEMRLAIGYVSGTATTEIGYMGFKVGDKVTWEPQMDEAQSAKNNKQNRHYTGIVDLLDSNKCYIKIDHSKMVAVKLYEDLTKVNP